jgi:hypothetical protein
VTEQTCQTLRFGVPCSRPASWRVCGTWCRPHVCCGVCLDAWQRIDPSLRWEPFSEPDEPTIVVRVAE